MGSDNQVWSKEFEDWSISLDQEPLIDNKEPTLSGTGYNLHEDYLLIHWLWQGQLLLQVTFY